MVEGRRILKKSSRFVAFPSPVDVVVVVPVALPSFLFSFPEILAYALLSLSLSLLHVDTSFLSLSLSSFCRLFLTPWASEQPRYRTLCPFALIMPFSLKYECAFLTKVSAFDVLIMRAPVHAAPLLSFLFLYSFLSSFYPPHPLFCQFPATTSPCPLPPPSSFAAYSFFLPNAFLSLLLFFSFPYGSRHIAEFRYIVRERNNASKLGQLPWRILGDSLERKMGRKHFFRLLRK